MLIVSITRTRSLSRTVAFMNASPVRADGSAILQSKHGLCDGSVREQKQSTDGLDVQIVVHLEEYLEPVKKINNVRVFGGFGFWGFGLCECTTSPTA